MLVIAKYQIGYKGIEYFGGMEIDLNDADYIRYKNDVYIKESEPKKWFKESDKQIKTATKKTFKKGKK